MPWNTFKTAILVGTLITASSIVLWATLRRRQDDEVFIDAQSTISSTDYESDAEYISAEETKDDEFVENVFWNTAVLLAKRGAIPARKMRVRQAGCTSITEFLSKLHCLRLASTLDDPLVEQLSNTMAEMCINVGSGFLSSIDRDPKPFRTAFNQLLQCNADIMKELKPRGVIAVTLFDMLDFVLLDSFDDLDNPPPAVTAVLGNTWIPISLRGSGVENAVWGAIMAKASTCRSTDGFLRNFYNVTLTFTPILSRIMLVKDDEYAYKLAVWLKHHLLQLVKEMFSCVDNCTTPKQVVENLIQMTQKYDEIFGKQLYNK